MTTTPQQPVEPQAGPRATGNLWMHVTRHSIYEEAGSVPATVRGERASVRDEQGRRYPDGLAGLFVVRAGHGRWELAEARARQTSELARFPLRSYAHPRAVALALDVDLVAGDVVDAAVAEAHGLPSTELSTALS